MASIGTLYSKGDSNGKKADVKVNKGFKAHKSLLFIEEGYNVRHEINQDTVEHFRGLYRNGKHVPDLVVERVGDRLKVIEGHHRYTAAMLEDDVEYLGVIDAPGTEKERLFLMIGSSQVNQLSNYERAIGYKRLIGEGTTRDEIAEAFGRTRPDVDNHLIFAEAPQEIIDAVNSGVVGFAAAVMCIRHNGENATTVLNKALGKAKDSGKSKVTKDDLSQKFTPKKAMPVIEALAACDLSGVLEQLPEDKRQEIENIFELYGSTLKK